MVDAICYFHIELAAHDVIYAEGVGGRDILIATTEGCSTTPFEVPELYPTGNAQVGILCPSCRG